MLAACRLSFSPDGLRCAELATVPGRSPVQLGIAMSTLITDEQRFLLQVNDRKSLENQDFEPAPVVKRFTPHPCAT